MGFPIPNCNLRQIGSKLVDGNKNFHLAVSEWWGKNLYRTVGVKSNKLANHFRILVQVDFVLGKLDAAISINEKTLLIHQPDPFSKLPPLGILSVLAAWQPILATDGVAVYAHPALWVGDGIVEHLDQPLVREADVLDVVWRLDSYSDAPCGLVNPHGAELARQRDHFCVHQAVPEN